MDETNGTVFDIKEFAVHDGPGMRCTVFLKGCPLRCSWCHNPEGLSPATETMRTAAGSRTVGTVYSPDELVRLLLRYQPIFADGNGGVTFSGGEPLLQAAFLVAVMKKLAHSMHILLQTSGYASAEDFSEAARLSDMVFFDVKLVDNALHKRYTGVGNPRILDNLALLDDMGISYRIRMPLIPGVTDSLENYHALRRFIETRISGRNLQGIDLLPYNTAAGGKYQALGETYAPDFDPVKPAAARPAIFQDIVREVKVL